MAVQHSGVMVASASPAIASSPCEVRIWKTTSGKCTKVCSPITNCYSVSSYSRVVFARFLPIILIVLAVWHFPRTIDYYYQLVGWSLFMKLFMIKSM